MKRNGVDGSPSLSSSMTKRTLIGCCSFLHSGLIIKVLLGASRKEQKADLLFFSPVEQQQQTKEKKREKTVTQQYQRSLSSGQRIVTLVQKEESFARPLRRISFLFLCSSDQCPSLQRPSRSIDRSIDGKKENSPVIQTSLHDDERTNDD